MSSLKFNKPSENRPKANLTEFESNLTYGKKVEQIPMPKIDVFEYNNQLQPFSIDETELKALQNSIEQNGQLTPVIVRMVNGRYQLLSGHKRYTACRNLSFKTIDGIVIDVESDEKAFDIVCQANVQRREPKPSELSKMYNTYLSMRKNQEFAAEKTTDNICELFNVSRKTMYRYANMSKLIEDISFLIDNKKINVNAIEDIIPLSEEQQKALADYINQNGKLSSKKFKTVISFLKDNNSCDIEEALQYADSDNGSDNNNISEPQSTDTSESINLISEIRKKFTEFADYTDKELSDYIMVLLSDDTK